MSAVTTAAATATAVGAAVAAGSAPETAVPGSAPETAAVSWPISAWRHHDPRVANLPGVALEDVDHADSSPDFAGELYRRGARRVAVHGVVDLHGAAPALALRQLALVRDLTGHGVAVDWRVRVDGAAGLLTHLYPPTELLGMPDGAAALGRWRDFFHLCRCVYRVGPGFIQVRDRRTGELNRLTIDDPEYIDAVDRLLPALSEHLIAPTILDDLAAENLVWRLGGLAVWLPYRARRWPWPAMAA
jgi:hypothetical protein